LAPARPDAPARPGPLAGRRPASSQGAFDPRRLALKGTLWVMAGYQALAEVEESSGGGGAQRQAAGKGGLALTARVLSVAGGCWEGGPAARGRAAGAALGAGAVRAAFPAE
jgi:hypothetical protein